MIPEPIGPGGGGEREPPGEPRAPVDLAQARPRRRLRCCRDAVLGTDADSSRQAEADHGSNGREHRARVRRRVCRAVRAPGGVLRPYERDGADRHGSYEKLQSFHWFPPG